MIYKNGKVCDSGRFRVGDLVVDRTKHVFYSTLQYSVYLHTLLLTGGGGKTRIRKVCAVGSCIANANAIMSCVGHIIVKSK